MLDLLGKFTFADNKRYLLIFDIDGTLRPDEIESLEHRYPKIDPEVSKMLMELNTRKDMDVIILTARSYLDVFKSNLPKSITKYCGCGKQLIENDILKYARPEFEQSYQETVMFIDILKDILGKKLIANLDFLITPGDFAIYFDLKDYKELKIQVMQVLNFILLNSSRWELLDFGKEVVFRDTKYIYDKGDSACEIIQPIVGEDHPTQVCMFGDSMTDYSAMTKLRAFQVENPTLRMKVSNVCVGNKLSDLENVDYVFDNYNTTLDFVRELYKQANT